MWAITSLGESSNSSDQVLAASAGDLEASSTTTTTAEETPPTTTTAAASSTTAPPTTTATSVPTPPTTLAPTTTAPESDTFAATTLPSRSPGATLRISGCRETWIAGAPDSCVVARGINHPPGEYGTQETTGAWSCTIELPEMQGQYFREIICPPAETLADGTRDYVPVGNRRLSD